MKSRATGDAANPTGGCSRCRRGGEILLCKTSRDGATVEMWWSELCGAIRIVSSIDINKTKETSESFMVPRAGESCARG